MAGQTFYLFTVNRKFRPHRTPSRPARRARTRGRERPASARIDARRARRDQAEAAFHETVLLAMEDVETSLASYGRDQRERDRLAKAVAAGARGAELAGARHRAGLDSFFAVLDAQPLDSRTTRR